MSDVYPFGFCNSKKSLKFGSMNRKTTAFNLPIPYIYCILISIGLGLFTGLRQYFLYNFLFTEVEEGVWVVQFWAAMMNQVLWGFLVPAVYWVYLRLGKKENRLRLSWGVLLGSVVVAAFHEFSSYFVWFGINDFIGRKELDAGIWQIIYKGFPAGFISQWFVFWIIYSIFAALVNARRFREKQVELANLQIQLSEARLNALKFQMQPHFLFNTLNTISSLIDFSKKDAQGIITKLGNLLRIILEKNARNSIPLQEELSFIENYLGIEEMRFQDRLTVTFKIQEETKSASVPRLILQPLVENAIKHGLKNKEENATILIESYELPDDRIFISVSDNGIGSAKSLNELTKNRIGLKNVKDRLQLMYGNAAQFLVKSQPNQGFAVVIEIPKK